VKSRENKQKAETEAEAEASWPSRIGRIALLSWAQMLSRLELKSSVRAGWIGRRHVSYEVSSPDFQSGDLECWVESNAGVSAAVLYREPFTVPYDKQRTVRMQRLSLNK
jgi:hypothetical protein